MPHTIFFDLDGTLTDSGPGIMNCAQLALDHFHISVEDPAQLRTFVGPPLRVSFGRFGLNDQEAEEAIRIFRSRYLTVGKFENVPYPGIPQLLQQLNEEGHRLFVATSKPEETAKEILHHFQLDQYFELICGATMDSSRESKEAVLSYLLAQTEAPSVLMVGDTEFDVIGANAHHIPTIGVTWGYGDEASMRQAGAAAIVSTPEELHQILDTMP
ncbi:MAG: HAD-IA family hydrolase [Evtepia sp.]|uniref:HAD-IA family hydrolase n=1 Tax=Evtepia sp. TaxID=2773933 RepID=UPI002A75BD73|nr:HAD-IA family hydrolase [Evtepia sp.]MDY3015380.1 HAD-IA family hydrolase [Evtepia sp.]